jgi:ankyrin repeat protein
MLGGYAMHTFRQVCLFGFLVLATVVAIGCQKKEEITLMTAVFQDDLMLLKQFETNGADLNQQFPDRWNWTPLVASVYLRNTNMIAYLIDRGVDVSKKDSREFTALMWAITAQDTNTVALLLRKRPDEIRKGEDWPHVFSLVAADNRQIEEKQMWVQMFSQFLGTNVVLPKR